MGPNRYQVLVNALNTIINTSHEPLAIGVAVHALAVTKELKE